MPAAVVSLVTGSARGLGLAVARRLSARGDRAHVVYRTATAEIAALEREFAGRVHQADLESEADVEKLVAEVLAAEGGLDHTVHAVGEYETGPLAELDPRDLRRLLSNNVESAFLLARAVRPALRERKGSLVFFGCAGLDGLRARRDAAAYCAAKSALVVLARSLAVEEAAFGVRVNLVSPGLIPHAHASPDTLDPKLLARIPFGRPGKPEEVAEAIAFLTSPAASYVTGSNLELGGGFML